MFAHDLILLVPCINNEMVSIHLRRTIGAKESNPMELSGLVKELEKRGRELMRILLQQHLEQ